MTAETLINPNIPALQTTDTVAAALHQMEEIGIMYLPVVDNDTFMGIVSEDGLFNVPNPSTKLSALELDGQRAFVFQQQHYYDLLRTSAQYKSRVIAVVDKEERYLGCATTLDLIAHLSTGYSMQQNGGVLVLSLYERDYSLAEISRLVESNNAKVLNATVDTDPDDIAKIRVTLKINQPDLGRVIATLERFGYIIAEQYHQSQTPDLDRERLGLLFRFLNI